jgi:hypothetical protein
MSKPTWTEHDVIWQILHLSHQLNQTPTVTQMGAALSSAATRIFGTPGAAVIACGLEPNKNGKPTPVALAKRKRHTTKQVAAIKATMPQPADKPKPKPHVPDKALIAEREAYLKRQRRRMDAEAKAAKRELELYGPRRKRNKGRSDFYGRVKWEKTEDYLPPADLTVVYRRKA